MAKVLEKSEVTATDGTSERVIDHPAWVELKGAVERLRGWQAADGSIDRAAADAPPQQQVATTVATITAAVAGLSPLLVHDADYHAALIRDLDAWVAGGCGVPDFLDSLLAFQPAAERVDGRQHLVVFPMYTQNGNPNRNFEAVVIRMVWPSWLAELEATRYDNPLFCGITFEDFTPGYDTNSAVLFPETVAVREVPSRFSWGAIFCDREAARFRRVTTSVVDLLGIGLPDEVRDLLADQQRCQDAFVLWDMVHDRTHSHGDLPFDPFMIKQRQPFWMYGLEELRCDLTAFRAAVDLARDAEQGTVARELLQTARDVQIAVLFDRMFRFPLTGSRVRNYDGLGGQLLFAYLHKHDAVRWTDNTLRIDWDLAVQTTTRLCDEIGALYRDGIDRPKLVHWLAGYDLVSAYLSPNPASRWAKGAEALDLDKLPRQLVDDVHPDEFPLSMFFEALGKKVKDVIASTEGITAQAA
ncbi:MAG: DUF6421 family protein [Nocardioides sp.]|uniref:DUF6421 family protein n=1 Tax=Nocardioides sp. TaxID=35761 RepID=UPI0039E5D886